MPSHELIGDVIEVVADDIRLRADPQNIVAGPLDQRRLPAGRHGPKRVPCVAGDKTELRGLNPELPLNSASRSLHSAAGTSECGGVVENFSKSSFLSASSILMPCVSASIFILANQRRMALFSPKMRAKTGSMVCRSSSVSVDVEDNQRKSGHFI